MSPRDVQSLFEKKCVALMQQQREMKVERREEIRKVEMLMKPSAPSHQDEEDDVVMTQQTIVNFRCPVLQVPTSTRLTTTPPHNAFTPATLLQHIRQVLFHVYNGYDSTLHSNPCMRAGGHDPLWRHEAREIDYLHCALRFLSQGNHDAHEQYQIQAQRQRLSELHVS